MSKPIFLTNFKKKICLICEGYEEYEYVERLLSLKVWADCYEFDLVNAKSNGNISARYQDRYQSDNYDVVFAFCDTDRRPEGDFERIRNKINNIFGNQIAADRVIIFTNPCTMQVILMHFGDTVLKTQNKHKNSSEIQRLTGLDKSKDYKGNSEQREYIFTQITLQNYHEMKKRISKLSKDYKENPSTNFLYYLSCFENSDTSWIEKVNKEIEAEVL